nr:RNA-directed DNA polymerase, eukaryota, reverse transcriptase zinc-binding domain protein [Tanacetum cinerariifolium]
MHSDRSFESVVHGKPTSHEDNVDRNKTRAAKLNDQDLISVDDTSKILLVKLKDLELAIDNDIDKVADTFNANSVDDLDEVLNKLNNDNEAKGNYVESPKVNDEDAQPTKEDNTSDLSCTPNFEHLKKRSSSRCSTSFARHRNKNIKGISFLHEFSRLIEVGGSLGLDVRGCRKSLNQMINGIQESKMSRLEPFHLKSMWGNYSFDYACNLARGRSGGLISMWDPNNFVKHDIWCDDAFIIVKGKWKNMVGDCSMVNMYGPHDPSAKIELWNRIRNFMQTSRGKYILSGDMNEIRNAQELVGSIFSQNKAEVFNNFIIDSNLTDLPLGGHAFT